MKVLVYGSGGREHTLYWKLKQSKLVTQLDCYPGNGGIDSIIDLSCTEDDLKQIVDFLNTYNYNLLVPGPEDPLVNGIVGLCKGKRVNAFGPTAKAAMLEGSKVIAKRFMSDYGIPTAKFKIFDNSEKARKYAEDYVEKKHKLLVAKADGLARGKGVIVPNSLDELLNAIDTIMVEKKFGDAGNMMILEEKLSGQEISYIVFTDGKTFKPMLASQDHKPIYDGDKGKNTGGMGAYAPVPFVDKVLEKRIQEEIVSPTIIGMKERGTPYRGALYCGLMLVPNGNGGFDPYLLEYNCRFGDPETQPILPLLKTDLAEIMLACINGYLDKIDIEWEDKYACCVVLASKGYPEDYKNNINKEIFGLDKIKDRDDIIVFHAGTKKEEGKILTAGGRVLGITGIDETLNEARDKTYSVIGKENNGIYFEGMQIRKDIAEKGLRY